MTKIEEHLKDISEIRTLMEESSKFLSLSGLSGISAGIVALIGAFWGNAVLNSKSAMIFDINHDQNLLVMFLSIGCLVLIFSLIFAVFFSIRMAKRKKLPVWNQTSKYLLISLLIPLITGGIFFLILLKYGFIFLAIPSTLIFYGLSLLNASKYTVKEIRYLAITQIILGLLGSYFSEYGLIYWGTGFGIAHIIYGTYLYLKYEK